MPALQCVSSSFRKTAEKNLMNFCLKNKANFCASQGVAC